MQVERRGKQLCGGKHADIGIVGGHDRLAHVIVLGAEGGWNLGQISIPHPQAALKVADDFADVGSLVVVEIDPQVEKHVENAVCGEIEVPVRG